MIINKKDTNGKQQQHNNNKFLWAQSCFLRSSVRPLKDARQHTSHCKVTAGMSPNSKDAYLSHCIEIPVPKGTAPKLKWTEAAKVEGGVPWHATVLQGAERFMTSWHKKEEEASR
ncbi:unnamed protein product [Ectocarpus sp. 12 AP-2014]